MAPHIVNRPNNENSSNYSFASQGILAMNIFDSVATGMVAPNRDYTVCYIYIALSVQYNLYVI